MFEKILFATDFSDISNCVVPYVREIAGLHRSTVYAVHVKATERHWPQEQKAQCAIT